MANAYKASKEEIIESYRKYYIKRMDKGLTDKDVSEKSQTARGTFTAWKHGQALPSLKSLYKIANLVDAKVSDIIGEIPKMVV